MKNVLVGCTGSVATIKIQELLEKIKEFPDITVKLGKLSRQLIKTSSLIDSKKAVS